jgi:hypothetical protein
VTPGGQDAEEILGEARRVADLEDLGATGVRAAALLGRSALESAIWSLFPSRRTVSGRAMLLTLATVTTAMGRPDIGRTASVAWSRLSAASHHHAYELPLTAVEVEHLLSLVDDVIAAIRQRQAATAATVVRATGT